MLSSTSRSDGSPSRPDGPGRVRVLGTADLPDALALIAADPVVNVFAAYRSATTQLDPRWLGGEMWGYFDDGVLVSMCHVGANLVPVRATPPAVVAFADRLRRGRTSSTMVGPRSVVEPLWQAVADVWGEPREVRWDQPHLEIASEPLIPGDPKVRRSEPADLEVLYPACVAMYEEEVGVSPERDGGHELYRARVSHLINRGWSFVRIEDDEVVFKAEVACASDQACQVQGVWVAPSRRGQGVGTRGMASVVRFALAEIAPVVSLYVNAHNTGARTAYQRVGFRQTETFSTIMF